MLVHTIVSTKERRPFLQNEVLRSELHRYLGGIRNRFRIGQPFPNRYSPCLAMMRNNLMTGLLVGLVSLSVLVTSGLAFLYLHSVQKLHRLQFQSALVTRNRAKINALAAETLDYSRRNPAINPLLQSVELKPKPGAVPSGSEGRSKPQP